MISDAFVTVNCDAKGCRETTDVELVALAGDGEYDCRNVAAKLERDGWVLEGGLNGLVYCPDCVAKQKGR